MSWASIFGQKKKQKKNNSVLTWQHTGMNLGHSHDYSHDPAGVVAQHSGVVAQHSHVVDTSAFYTYEVVPDKDICIYYDSSQKQIRRVRCQDNLYSWDKNEIMNKDQLCEVIGDIFGGIIQDGGDIQLFKAMMGEKIKEVIDEFTPGGNK